MLKKNYKINIAWLPRIIKTYMSHLHQYLTLITENDQKSNHKKKKICNEIYFQSQLYSQFLWIEQPPKKKINYLILLQPHHIAQRTKYSCCQINKKYPFLIIQAFLFKFSTNITQKPIKQSKEYLHKYLDEIISKTLIYLPTRILLSNFGNYVCLSIIVFIFSLYSVWRGECISIKGN